MRILVAIPHYFAPGRQDSGHGSQTSNPAVRGAGLAAAILAMHQHLGASQAMIQVGERRTIAANTDHRSHVDVVICTTGDAHLLGELDISPSLYSQAAHRAAPLALGFCCHQVLRERAGDYDYYGYLEDDIILHDPWFVRKLIWFNRFVGMDSLLLPNRYERSTGASYHKVYLDGDLAPHVTAPFQDVRDRASLRSTVMEVPVRFQRPLNPHAGCFFLNTEQLDTWTRQPEFGKPDSSFIGPLESAATLGIMKTFRIYKPSPDCADFLEVEHSGTGFTDKIMASK